MTAYASTVDVKGLIRSLEGAERDQSAPVGPPVWGPLIGQRDWWQIHALARFWDPPVERQRTTPQIDIAQHMVDLLIGLHRPGVNYAYLLLGDDQGVTLAMSAAGGGLPPSTLPVLLRGLFPGVEVAEQSTRTLGVSAHGKGIFAYSGMLTGIPTNKTREDPQRKSGVSQQVERILRGLAGQRWGWLVCASAIPQATSARQAVEGMDRITAVSQQLKQQVSYTAPGHAMVDGRAQALSQTMEQTNYDAKRCLELLEKNLTRAQIAHAEGMWETTAYFFGASEEVRNQAGALLRATFAGEESVPEPIRVFVRGSAAHATDAEFQTLLNSRELATLSQMPREESPGFAIRDFALFDTDVSDRSAAGRLVELGEVTVGGRPVGRSLRVAAEDLTKHTLVVGVTGSGKTSTIFSLLDSLHDAGHGVPFLVLEPAKNEYRSLWQLRTRFPQLRVYTLGDERVAPFRHNPFSFAIGSAQHRISVQTHIDFLKAVFNAAFVLYTPMPYVLETCLHEVYEDAGWDLATSTNQRLPHAQQGLEADWPVFPTLSDLHAKVDEVVSRLGYEEKIEMDVKAGLKARIDSLRIGGKGFMLDCQHSLPIVELLAHPTVLELSAIGNEEEKAFLLGILLTAIYEYHIVEAQVRGARTAGAPATQAGLRHLTVIEEAHRLLKNVSTEQSTEGANTRGQAVETFANMLSEIRGYGEGVVIAEQIPTKLTPDAIKNTNLKLVHRLLAGDDRAVLAATMNMDEGQSRYLTTLRPGQAVAHAEGADHPYLLAVRNGKHGINQVTSDADIRATMLPHLQRALYNPVTDFAHWFDAALVQSLEGKGISLSYVRNSALRLLRDPGFRPVFDRYLLGIVERPGEAVVRFRWIAEAALAHWVEGEILMPTILFAVLAAVDDHARRRGRQYRWPYHRLENLYGPLRRALARTALHYPYAQSDLGLAQAELAPVIAATQGDLTAFSSGYAALATANAPYGACRHCGTPCRFRFEAEALTNAGDVYESLRLLAQIPDDTKMWFELAESCRGYAAQIVMLTPDDPPVDACVCVALHGARRLGFTEAIQTQWARNVRVGLVPPPAGAQAQP